MTSPSHLERTDSIVKPEIETISNADAPKDSSMLESNDSERKAFEKRTMRKVDWRVLPILGALYSVSLIDRGNLSIARAVGAERALGLQIGNRYTIAAVLFFVPYIILELPSNYFVRRVGPSRWLGSIAVLWGAAMIGMGFVNTWGQLAIVRFLLGILEAGFFPACVYLISLWYTRREVQTRMATFYLISLLVSGFSNIMCYGFFKIGPAGGLAGWRWIFIMCGILTCALGIFAFFVITDFPDRNKFLTPEQTALVRTRIDNDRGDSEPDSWSMAKISAYCRELKIWAFGLLFMSSTLVSYALNYFLPVILGSMGYSIEKIFLLSAPPYVAAAGLSLIFAYISDRIGLRAPIIAIQAIISIIGLAMTSYATSNAARYAGVFLGLSGASGNVPAILAYQANNIVGQSKRGFASAIVIGFGGIGGVIATTVFRQADYPFYRPGLWVAIACQIMMLAILVALSLYFTKANRAVKNGTRVNEGMPGFLYTL